MTFSPIHLMNARLTQGDKAEFSFPKDYTTFLLVIEGNIYINESIDVKAEHLLLCINSFRRALKRIYRSIRAIRNEHTKRIDSSLRRFQQG